jgi:hypothetical protein
VRGKMKLYGMRELEKSGDNEWRKRERNIGKERRTKEEREEKKENEGVEKKWEGENGKW